MIKKGQVWIETVLYTLISLSLIGLILSIAMPKINEAQDRNTIEQAITTMQNFDSKISSAIEASPGNTRVLDEFRIRRGKLIIDGVANQVLFRIDDLKSVYSEPEVDIPFGKIILTTKKGQKVNSVTLQISYNANITYSGRDELKDFSSGSLPYKFVISNLGSSVNIEETSSR